MRRPSEKEAVAAGGGGRLERAFAACRERGEAALVTYVMAGDPDLGGSVAMALACVQGGADVLEIGMPFSDPIADGPTLQRAAMRALAARTQVKDCFTLVTKLRRQTQVPVALMGYLNPVLAYGERRFFASCEEAGVDAVILPDLPPEEAGELGALAAKHGVRTVFLVAPTSTPERIDAVCRATTGFVYFVSVTGVTGARTALPAEVGRQVAQVRARTERPVVVGFGVSKPEQARALAAHADGVVVGSAIVQRVEQPGTVGARAGRVKRFVSELKAACRASRARGG